MGLFDWLLGKKKVDEKVKVYTEEESKKEGYIPLEVPPEPEVIENKEGGQ